MSKEKKPAAPSAAPPTSPPASSPPPALTTTTPAAKPNPSAQPPKPVPAQPASPNLPAEHKYIDVKVGDFVEFKVRRPDGELWRIGKVTSLNRDFSDIMPLDSERIYCTHKEFIRRVLSKDEVAVLPEATNWYIERH